MGLIMKNFENKTVFITGASSGIGAALAREFAHRKANLVLTARRRDRLEALSKELSGESRTVLPVTCDVTDEKQLAQAVQLSLEKLGKIDIVIANAGFGVAGKLEKLSVQDYERQFQTNIFGVLKTIYATLEPLKKSRGTLVLIGSVSGYISLPGVSAYSMSKFAIHALASSIRYELSKSGVSVVLIAPGFVESEIRQVDNSGKFHAATAEPIPKWLVMSTERAARQMVNAIAKKRPEQIITLHGKIGVFIKRHFPWMISLAMSFGLKGRREPNRS